MTEVPRFNDLSSPRALLATRRSGRPREMIAPGPTAAELGEILALAARVPDHGKLAPWRLVVIEDRAKFAQLLVDAFRAERLSADDPRELDAVRQFATQAPTLVAVLSHPAPSAKIPLWEQELSTGALCMNLLTAAHAYGYTGGWLTGWATYSPTVTAALGAPGDRLAGFIFVGTPGRALEERPRPDPSTIISRWA